VQNLWNGVSALLVSLPLIKLNCSFEIRGGELHAIVGKASSLMGFPYDRPVAGYGGKNINTLRLWAAKAPDYFGFQTFGHGDFVGAVAEKLAAETLLRRFQRGNADSTALPENNCHRDGPGAFARIYDTLLTNGDHYMHLADMKSYLDADQRLRELYANADEWVRKAILNVAGSGKFSSDRSISEYATHIWEVKPCPVP